MHRMKLLTFTQIQIRKTKERERQSIQHERTSRICNNDESTSSISEKVKERAEEEKAKKSTNEI